MKNLQQRELIVVVITSVLCCLPIMVVDIPPLVDLPNHLARAYIASLPTSHSVRADLFDFNWQLAPSIGLDLILVAMTKLSGIEQAARVMTILTLLSIITGVGVLRSAITGKVDLLVLLSVLLGFNALLYFGMIGYLFSTGIGLILWGIWIRQQQTEGSSFLRTCFLATGFTLLYFLHLYSLFIFAFIFLIYELGVSVRHRAFNWQRIFQIVIATVPALALFGYFLASSGVPENRFWAYGNTGHRIFALMSPVWFSTPAIDLIFAISAWGLLGLSLYKGWIHESLRLPIIALILLACIAPASLSGVGFTHIRLPVIVMLVALAGLQVPLTNLKLKPVIVGLGIVLISVRLSTTALLWLDRSQEYLSLREALSRYLTPGSAMITAQGGTQIVATDAHIATYGVTEAGVYVPEMFTGRALLSSRPAYRHIDPPDPSPISVAMLQAADTSPSPYYWNQWRNHFDYLLVIERGTAGPVPDGLTALHRGTFFTLYKINDQNS